MKNSGTGSVVTEQLMLRSGASLYGRTDGLQYTIQYSKTNTERHESQVTVEKHHYLCSK